MSSSGPTDLPHENHRSGSPEGQSPSVLGGSGVLSGHTEGAVLTPDSTVPFRSVGFTVSTIGFAVAERFREILAPVGLEPREFALLRSVQANEGQSQQAVGERLRIPASRMVAFVDALEARGLLERRHNPDDRRTRALHLTDSGRKLLAAAFSEAVAHEQNVCGDLNADEREQLLDLLGKVASRLGLAPGVHSAMAHTKPVEE
ncbi:MAG: MarR family winged helix-turn-helix transcriptional regulator [Solirubrobacteraceae bacterium]